MKHEGSGSLGLNSLLRLLYKKELSDGEKTLEAPGRSLVVSK